MVTDAEGNLGSALHLRDEASKGSSGRVIPLNKGLRRALQKLHDERDSSSYVITTERSEKTSAAAIVNLFAQWYGLTGLKGCSSHSGRRTFITNAARTISTVGGSLRDVQMLAGHRAHTAFATTLSVVARSSKTARTICVAARAAITGGTPSGQTGYARSSFTWGSTAGKRAHPYQCGRVGSRFLLPACLLGSDLQQHTSERGCYQCPAGKLLRPSLPIGCRQGYVTGQWARAITSLETEPSTSRATPPLPPVPTTM